MHDGEKCPGHGAAGLRERKKSETREAISRAAERLALKHGPENVRVADIAAAANVSPRTYNNYFDSVPEAICASTADRALALADAIRARPADEPLVDAVANALVELHSGVDRSVLKTIICTPALRGEFFKAIAIRDVALAEVVAERTGTETGGLHAAVVAATISGVTRVVSQRCMMDETADYQAMLREALAIVAPMTERKTSGRQAA